jgi:hypothetical protein
LPSSIYGAGVKTLYRWTVTADSKGDIGWKKVVFDVTGSVQIASNNSYTLGMGTSTSALNYAVYMGTSADLTSIKAVSSLQVWDTNTNTEITAANTPFVYNGGATGGAKVIFIANTEQVVAAGSTKTYELRGTFGYAGYASDSITTNIAALSSSTSTSAYAAAAGGAGATATSTAASFVWSDRSGDDTGSHSATTADWTNDFKVFGIPTQGSMLFR